MTVPARVGVIGGGTMGAGIAQTFATAGADVVVMEIDGSAVEAARTKIVANIRRAAARDVGLNASVVEGRIVVYQDYEELRSAELVIEAVPEIPALKVETLARAEAVMDDDAWLVTNTSSLSITSLGTELRRPERFCGLHFFNPVPRSALVEIVLTDRTSSALREAAAAWVEGLGKTPIIVRDSPGFASSRLGLALALEAMRMLEDGVASAEDIDAAMVLGYRHASGPLLTTDLVGLDVRLGIAEHLAATLGERFEPPQILRDLVADGHLGRKTGRGFFDYSTDGEGTVGKTS